MKRVAEVAAWTGAGSVASWIVFRAAGIDVEAGPFFLWCIVVLATGLAMDFLERRVTDARVAAGVAAAGATIIVRDAVEMADPEVEGGVYVVLFASVFVSHLVPTMRVWSS